MELKNPVVGTVICQQCGETETVHEVKRGGSKRRGQLYTRCPDCGCNQTTGAKRQRYLIENTNPRPEYAELFEFKRKPDEPQPDGVSADDMETEEETDDEPGKPQPGGIPAPVVAVGVIGSLVGLSLLFLGVGQ